MFCTLADQADINILSCNSKCIPDQSKQQRHYVCDSLGDSLFPLLTGVGNNKIIINSKQHFLNHVPEYQSVEFILSSVMVEE